ncbi:DUF4625 domain-containing protein [Pedobacter psychrodurus]|uniref:DUF4625 domain-containing protein n=1 Tax=Pedobacter psychrodurus TaxID=2530456 RepID=UPI00292E48A4|nr:DUF4625 domain-containing protein [Pedobacter psychrodurus]
MKKSIHKSITLLMLLVVFATGCKKEKDPEIATPTASNIEIGTANNKQAIRGRDFHLNVDVIAGDKIKGVEIKILQKAGQTYTANWKFELAWDQYNGVKNTNVHKHFTIPAEAPEGRYDFCFIVYDENGTRLELKEDFTILDATSIEVDPKIGRDIFSRNGTMIYYMDTYVEQELIFKKGDEFTAHAQVSEIKGDGILYTILIKRKANYFPESIDKLDFSKAIVISKVAHTGLPNASKVSTLKQINGTYGGESIIIGTERDGNEPISNLINGEKAWESGKYNLVILYKNTTYNMSTYKSIPITIVY